MGNQKKQHREKPPRALAPALVAALLGVLLVVPVFAGAGGWLPGYSAPAAQQGPAPAEQASQPRATTELDEPNEPNEPDNEAASEDASGQAGDDPLPAYEEGRVLAELAPSTTVEQAEAAFADDELLAGVSIEPVSDTLVKLSLPEALAVEDAVDVLSNSTVVQGAQPNYYYYAQDAADGESAAEATATAQLVSQSRMSTASLIAGTDLGNALGVTAAASFPNDPLYSSQWELKSVHAPEAWETVQDAYDRNSASGKKPVTVAVIDEGFLGDHEDLAGNVAFTYNSVAGVEQLDATEKTGPISHGTHVAGIAGAVTNNGKGVASAAGSFCKLGLVQAGFWNKAGNAAAFSDDTLCRAIDYVVSRAQQDNVKVINMSIGALVANEVTRAKDQRLYDAIGKARANGIVTVVAACNSPNVSKLPSYAYPSDFDNVVSVINLEQDANAGSGVSRHATSNYNKGSQRAKNISAPGTAIMSAASGATDGYRRDTGTSMAAPLVAGILGLAFTMHPDMTPSQAVNMLYDTARDIGDAGWDAETGYGEVDAQALVTSGEPAAEDPVDQSSSEGKRAEDAAPDAPDAPETPETPETPDAPGESAPNDAPSGTPRDSLAESDAAPASDAPATLSTVSVYRLFNKYTSEHFFTTSKSEMRSLRKAGWKYEGVAWKAPEKSTVPVYRLVNKKTGEHLYTKSVSERNKLRKSGWKYERIAWYSNASKVQPVYRLYNPKARVHHFTASAKERNKLKKLGWKRQGTAFYAA